MKKKILILLPDLPQKSYLEPIAQSLYFLNGDYHLEFIDPTELGSGEEDSHYFHQCQKWLKNKLPHYDAFFGFSFGGVILQQCFSLFEQLNKPIVLFSTPSFADTELKSKLEEVIHLCKADCIEDALVSLYKHVFYPNQQSPTRFDIKDKKDAARRMIFGLQKVLDTDSRAILQQTTVHYMHLIGDCSHLVNVRNVVVATSGRLVKVPAAGMRVLQDNPAFCEAVILEQLR
jgi:hypothetical protein